MIGGLRGNLRRSRQSNRILPYRDFIPCSCSGRFSALERLISFQGQLACPALCPSDGAHGIKYVNFTPIIHVIGPGLHPIGPRSWDYCLADFFALSFFKSSFGDARRQRAQVGPQSRSHHHESKFLLGRPTFSCRSMIFAGQFGEVWATT